MLVSGLGTSPKLVDAAVISRLAAVAVPVNATVRIGAFVAEMTRDAPVKVLPVVGVYFRTTVQAAPGAMDWGAAEVPQLLLVKESVESVGKTA